MEFEIEGVFRSVFVQKKMEFLTIFLIRSQVNIAYEEVFVKSEKLIGYQNFSNWYGIKGNKEWWAFCFPQLQYVDNDIAWR